LSKLSDLNWQTLTHVIHMDTHNLRGVLTLTVARDGDFFLQQWHAVKIGMHHM